MNVLQFKEVIKFWYPIGRPVCGLSSPGLGKSSVVFQACEELAVKYDEPFGMIEIRGASSSPAELAAIKYVDDSQVLEAEQAWLPTNEKVAAGECEKRGYIFCDEMGGGLPAVVSTLQRLFLDRKLGGLTLADGWRVVAASNRAKDRAASSNLSRAFLNRCVVVQVDPDADVLYKYGSSNGFDYRVLAFIRFQKDCVADGLEIHLGDNQQFCSPRTLHYLSDSFMKSDIVLDPATVDEMTLGIIGDRYGHTFNQFVKIIDSLPDLDQILQDPNGYPIPREINVIWATIGALMSRAEPGTARSIVRFFSRLSPELSYIAMRDIYEKLPDVVDRLSDFSDWAVKNVEFSVN